MNRERLLNVAKALRESPSPEDFGMETYAHGCGTPGCALGHYAYRTDLQDDFMLVPVDDGMFVHTAVAFRGQKVEYFSDCVRDHFGIDYVQVGELFAGYGCGEAQTPTEAAEYIENFVKEAP